MSIKRLAFLFAIAATVAYGLRAAVFEGIYIASASMEPTLRVGAHFFLDKVTLRLRDIQRGDIIVFRAPVEPHEEMVKRVIAVPGETVEMKDKKVYIGGQLLDEPYAAYSRAGESLKGDSWGPLEVPPNHFVVLGDNRDESNDSSTWRDAETGEHDPFLGKSKIRGLLRGTY